MPSAPRLPDMTTTATRPVPAEVYTVRARRTGSTVHAATPDQATATGSVRATCGRPILGTVATAPVGDVTCPDCRRLPLHLPTYAAPTDRMATSQTTARSIRADQVAGAARAFLLAYGIREATDGQVSDQLVDAWNRWSAYALVLGITQDRPGLHGAARAAGRYLGGIPDYR